MSGVASALEPAPSGRTIWTFWLQGFDQAPGVVQACLDSWRRLNPGWRVVALDNRSLRQIVDLDGIMPAGRPDVTSQKIAAVGRLCLLRKYGGVWTDATVYCLKPLDDWLPEYLADGYFAFRNPGPDRLASNWFIASGKDDPILVALHDAFVGMWREVHFTNQETEFGKRVLAKLSPRLNATAQTSIAWTGRSLQQRLRVYPYFIFHYTFNKMILENPELRRRWQAAKAADARLPHLAQQLASAPGGLERLVAHVEARGSPMQKLDWRIDAESDYWRGAMEAFLRATATQPASLVS